MVGEGSRGRPATSSSVGSARPPSARSAASDVRSVSTSRSPKCRFGRAPRSRSCVPGYGGHIASKVAENVHGGTFHCENERAASLSSLSSSTELRRPYTAPEFGTGIIKSRGLRHAPTVPGYAGFVPGKRSESVIGLGFTEANKKAIELKSSALSPCDTWMKRGKWPVDRMHTYNWTNRFVQADTNPLFTEAQFAEALESSRRLGRTFGMPPPTPNFHRPGDRFLHSLGRGGRHRKSETMLPDSAGMSTHSPQLDQQRWAMHNTLSLGSGNQRCAY
mmetsp:Transcript_110045/g.206317  ORF Transcript_110045/g.206317 Transcript_110045/m.206317 type:complete len:276 (+) Transcript_110045:49-876(+)